MLQINDIRQLYLGIQGENGIRTLNIDVSAWLVANPNGAVSIWHKRNGDATPSATGATLDRDTGILSWTPTSTDTYYAGDGQAEIRLTEYGVIKKTKAIRTGVSPAVTLAGQTLGSDWQSYINAVEAIKAEAVEAAETAEEAAEASYAAEDAKEAAEAAQAAAETAQGKAEAAQEAAEAAQTAAETAQGKAEDAQDAAETAQTAAETAQGKAEDAQDAAETAQTDAEAAQNAAETAQGKAEDAQDAAETAQTAAAGSATTAETQALKAEGYAVGKQNGTDVTSGSDYYQNNSKYFSTQASGSATTASTKAGEASDSATAAAGSANSAATQKENAEAWAIGKRNGTDIGSSDPAYNNHSKYWACQAAAAATSAMGDVIDDTAGAGQTMKVWSADKLTNTFAGKADLVDGLIPSNQLPGYIDNIEEYPSISSFPLVGSTNKIYVALDTNKNYRWSGSTYTELSKYDTATPTSSGLMSAEDKVKLDSVASRTVNGKAADENNNYVVDDVEFAHQIVTPDAQRSSGSYFFRTTGGEASLSDGDAKLLSILGRYTHTGQSEAVVTMTVTPAQRSSGSPIAATIDRDTFIANASSSGTYTFSYTDSWDTNPATYGITVVGEPISGDFISVAYTEEERGTMTFSNPTSFISTGWNLYKPSADYSGYTGLAHVKKYSTTYGLRIDGTYTSIEYSETISGTKETITVTGSLFNVPGDGYVWVTGGSTDTCIYMTWSDWINGHDGSYADYTEDEIDLTGAMAYFTYGLLAVGSIADEINLEMGETISRIERWSYSAANMTLAKNSGRPYEADENYIYIVRSTPVTNSIVITADFDAYDHGYEKITGGNVAPYVNTQYGQNLVDKLRHDVVVKSDVLDMVYPVGSIYMSVANTSPATLFGGTWEQLKDKFLLGCGDTYSNGATGGADSQSYTPAGTVGSHTLTTDEIPSHNHTFTGSEVTSGNQSADHTHNYTDYYATTTGNCALTSAQNGSHSHQFTRNGRTSDSASTGGFATNSTYNSTWENTTTSSSGSGNNHSHGGSNTSTTRTSQGVSANHTHKVTAEGSIGNTGGGGGHDHGFTGTAATISTLPPYLAVYMWKRTA